MGLAELASAAAIALIGLALIMSAAWSIQRATGNAGWIDAFWTFGVGAMGVVLAVAPFGGGEDLWRRVIVAALAAAWSLRLGLHIVKRTLKSGDDPRYARLMADWGSAAPARLFAFLQAQAAVGAVLALAIALAAQAPGPLRLQDVVGMPLMAAAIAGEAAADCELARFKADPANRGAICDVGLWRLSRHPNYVCEFMVWGARRGHCSRAGRPVDLARAPCARDHVLDAALRLRRAAARGAHAAHAAARVCVLRGADAGVLSETMVTREKRF